MSAAWRLATNSLSERRSRSLLLAGAVALSAALIVCVACAMASVHGAINHQIGATVGAADLVVQPAGSGKVLSADLLDKVRAWGGVAGAVGRLQGTVALSVKRPVLEPAEAGGFVRRDRFFVSTAVTNSTTSVRIGNLSETTKARTSSEDIAATLAPPPELLTGRLPLADDEIVLDALLVYRLSYDYFRTASKRDGYIPIAADPDEVLFKKPAPSVPEFASTEREASDLNLQQGIRVGDEVQVIRSADSLLQKPLSLPIFQRPRTLKVVGIAAQPPLGGRAQAYMTLSGLQRLTGEPGLSQIDIAILEGIAPQEIADSRRAELPKGLIIQTTQKITSGLDKNMQSSQLGMVLATVMAFLSAAFIIMTGLTTNVAERQRELAILRCIGGERRQLAQTQLLIGLIVGIAGAIFGVPLGVLMAWTLTTILSEQLPTGFVFSWLGVILGVIGSVGAGLLGAAWPAWRVARISPLEALAARAESPTSKGVLIVTAAGLACLIYQFISVGLPENGQVAFWAYATSGLPLMAVGYFLLGVPVVLLLSRLVGRPLSVLLALPPRLLTRTVGATPYRHGFTAGALMAGLALMVAIWTNGGAMLRDWLRKIEFPDAFVSGLNLPEEAQARLQSLPIVAQTAAVTLHPVETDAFGVRAIQKYKTTFVGFDPGPFFRMAHLKWIQGDPDTAQRRLDGGGAVIVAREFLTAKGMGVGTTFVAHDGDREHTFEIVGVVSSPGLEIASKFFNVGEDYMDQAVHAVFGSRADMKAKFFGGEPAPIHLIQIDLTPEAERDDEASLVTIRRELIPYGILDAGSGKQIKEQITFFARGGLLAVTTIAFFAMLVACFGVANLIIAGIETRQFEFGVLRAVGAQRGLLNRLVIGEAILIALTACLLGTLMGIQGSWAGQRLYALLLGLDLRLRPPAIPILAGCLIITVLTLLAAYPAIWRLNRKRPRDLLAAMKG
jgi:putative ABC transport system permease protein